MARNVEEVKAKPANDAYTGMLAVSLVALLIGIAVLYLDYSQYPATPPPKVDFSFRDRTGPPDQIVKERKAEETPEEKDAQKDAPDKKSP